MSLQMPDKKNIHTGLSSSLLFKRMKQLRREDSIYVSPPLLDNAEDEKLQNLYNERRGTALASFIGLLYLSTASESEMSRVNSHQPT